MTGKELLYHMSELDADLIGEAETAFSRRKAVPHVRKWLAVAACICLVPEPVGSGIGGSRK